MSAVKISCCCYCQLLLLLLCTFCLLLLLLTFCWSCCCCLLSVCCVVVVYFQLVVLLLLTFCLLLSGTVAMNPKVDHSTILEFMVPDFNVQSHIMYPQHEKVGQRCSKITCVVKREFHIHYL